MFSCIKTLRADPSRIFPDRGLVTMTQPFLRAYTQVGEGGPRCSGSVASLLPGCYRPAGPSLLPELLALPVWSSVGSLMSIGRAKAGFNIALASLLLCISRPLAKGEEDVQGSFHSSAPHAPSPLARLAPARSW